jgi:hypothetical protein
MTSPEFMRSLHEQRRRDLEASARRRRLLGGLGAKRPLLRWLTAERPAAGSHLGRLAWPGRRRRSVSYGVARDCAGP